MKVQKDPFKELREAYERHRLRLAEEFLAEVELLPDPEPDPVWEVLVAELEKLGLSISDIA